MKFRSKSSLRSEDGSVILLFAACLVVLIFFVGIAIDLSMAYMQRNDLENLCQLIRQDRFTYQDTIRYADNPGASMYQVVSNTMADNGFDGTITVYFYEKNPEANYRYYRTRVKLEKEFTFYFLRLFGADHATIAVSVDGGETYGEGMTDVVWHPSIPVSGYNGSYTGTATSGYTFTSGDVPAEW